MTGAGIQIDLSVQAALVSGASRGIGRAVARTLAPASADVIGIGTGIEANDGGPSDQFAAVGRDFHLMNCSLAERDRIRAMPRKLDTRGHSVDIFVNIAGIIHRARATAHFDEDWDAVIAVDLESPYVLARERGRRMVDRGHGKIVFVAAVRPFRGGLNVLGHAAGKGAIAQLTRVLAHQWAAHGVNVTVVAPSYVDTDNTAARKADAERNATRMSRVPTGRWGHPRGHRMARAVFGHRSHRVRRWSHPAARRRVGWAVKPLGRWLALPDGARLL